MNLLQIIKFLLEFLTVIELTPSAWFEQGLNLFEVLFISWGLTFLRVMIEIGLVRLGFGVGELILGWLMKLIKLMSPNLAERLNNFYERGDGKRTRFMSWLKSLGNVGLFMLGLLPLPYSGALGAIIYNLEQIHKPWYNIANLSFVCLLGGWLVKMTVFVWLAS